MSCRSDLSDSLPQQPQRRAVCRPSSVPRLNLACLAGICQEDSDAEAMIIDENYEQQGAHMVYQMPPPNAKIQMHMHVSGPLTDTCGSGTGGSSTASTRAESTP